MADYDIFQYLNDVYDLLPEADQVRYGETWKAYEQLYGYVWTQLMERKLSINIDNLPLYNNFRWQQHTFDSTTQLASGAFHYQLSEKFLVSIPTFQDKIHDEMVTVLLKEGADYTIEFGTGIITFVAQPPAQLWAKNNYVNLETPYNNFGYLLGIYDKNTPNYLKAIKGLWYAFWTGPSPENIRRSLYLLFGLPAASQAGTVSALSDTQITVTYQDATQETFTIPSGLTALVALGDTVTRFQPLVSGIQVLDKVNSPGFVSKYVGRSGIQRFLTENATRGTDPSTDESKALLLLEKSTYLPQININCFISADISLANVVTFLTTIQPKSRTFLPQILVGEQQDTATMQDLISQDIVFDVAPNMDYNPLTSGTPNDRLNAEIAPTTGMSLDSESLLMWDSLRIEVMSGGSLIDSCTV